MIWCDAVVSELCYPLTSCTGESYHILKDAKLLVPANSGLFGTRPIPAPLRILSFLFEPLHLSIS